MRRDRNNAVRRTIIFAIAVPLLAATAMSVLTAGITDTKDSGPGSSTFKRNRSGIASTSRIDITSYGNQNAYVTLSLYPATGSPTSLPTPPPCIGEYVISQIEDSCVPGETDIDNHGHDTVTTVALPFPYSLYGGGVQLDQSVIQWQCAVYDNG